MFENSFATILVGLRDTQLTPLTNERTKAAIPFGGKYRIIDFALKLAANIGLDPIQIAFFAKATTRWLGRVQSRMGLIHDTGAASNA